MWRCGNLSFTTDTSHGLSSCIIIRNMQIYLYDKIYIFSSDIRQISTMRVACPRLIRLYCLQEHATTICFQSKVPISLSFSLSKRRTHYLISIAIQWTNADASCGSSSLELLSFKEDTPFCHCHWAPSATIMAQQNHYYGSHNCEMSVSSYALTKKASPLAHVV